MSTSQTPIQPRDAAQPDAPNSASTFNLSAPRDSRSRSGIPMRAVNSGTWITCLLGLGSLLPIFLFGYITLKSGWWSTDLRSRDLCLVYRELNLSLSNACNTTLQTPAVPLPSLVFLKRIYSGSPSEILTDVGFPATPKIGEELAVVMAGMACFTLTAVSMLEFLITYLYEDPEKLRSFEPRNRGEAVLNTLLGLASLLPFSLISAVLTAWSSTVASMKPVSRLHYWQLFCFYQLGSCVLRLRPPFLDRYASLDLYEKLQMRYCLLMASSMVHQYGYSYSDTYLDGFFIAMYVWIGLECRDRLPPLELFLRLLPELVAAYYILPWPINGWYCIERFYKWDRPVNAVNMKFAALVVCLTPIVSPNLINAIIVFKLLNIEY